MEVKTPTGDLFLLCHKKTLKLVVSNGFVSLNCNNSLSQSKNKSSTGTL